MSSRIGSGTTSRGDGGGPAGLNNVVPNLQSMRRSSPNSSSQYSQWRIQKDLGGRCSWKFVAIFFVLLSVILVSALIYTTGKMTINFKNCQPFPRLLLIFVLRRLMSVMRSLVAGFWSFDF